tara:strand:- start:292 stop:504 length:213 start_codon:yes stop_codon:yes gene_type:complete
VEVGLVVQEIKLAKMGVQAVERVIMVKVRVQVILLQQRLLKVIMVDFHQFLQDLTILELTQVLEVVDTLV